VYVGTLLSSGSCLILSCDRLRPLPDIATSVLTSESLWSAVDASADKVQHSSRLVREAPGTTSSQGTIGTQGCAGAQQGRLYQLTLHHSQSLSRLTPPTPKCLSFTHLPPPLQCQLLHVSGG
jgi:hypothetical protein